MTNLTTIPLQDGFETTLAQAWNGSSTTVYVNSTPTATFAGSISTYLVVDPGLSTMQVVPCTAYDSVAKTFTVTTAPTPKGNGVNYSAVSHSAGAVVRISDNYAFWSDMLNAINTKLDDNGGNGKDYADTAARDAALGGDGAATKNYRLIKAGSNYYNYNLSTNQWQVVSTGTAPTNASTTVAGVVEIADSIEITNGTDTGATGAKTVVQPSHLKATNDNIATEALKGKSKQDVVVATTANITLSGTQTIDGVAVTAGQRVLVKNQTAGQENGIYLCAAGAWTRAVDFDTNVSNEVDLGAYVWVQGGTVGAGTMWTLATTGAITVGTTPIVFEAIGGFGNFNYKKTSITSTNVRISANTERSTNASITAPGILVKTIRVPLSGVVNVYMELKIGNNPYTANGVVYKNGVASGIANATTNLTYTAFNNDIYVGEGDILDMYIYPSNNATLAYVQNYRLRYDISAGNVGVVITD